MADKPKQLYFDFDEYIRQGEPEAAESAKNWNIAIGLQAVYGVNKKCSPFGTIPLRSSRNITS